MLDAGVPIPLAKLFESSDIILIGSITEGQRVDESSLQPGTESRNVPEGLEVHACKFSFKVIKVIRDERGKVTDNTLPLLWYIPSPTCQADYENAIGPGWSLKGPALWFMRAEGGFVRPTVDNLAAVRSLIDVGETVMTELDRWRDPRFAVAYLFMTPGVVTAVNEFFPDHESIGTIDLVGWSGYLEIYRSIFRRLGPAAQAEVCLVVAQFGMCLKCARRIATTTSPGRHIDSQLHLLDGARMRDFERQQIKDFSADSEAELLQRFTSLSRVKDELAIYACSSGESLRASARRTLEHVFGVDVSKISCIPCDSE